MTSLPREFYFQPTKTVAQKLLGCRLVFEPRRGQRLVGKIVETEAYLGSEDPACHSFGGRRTKRVQSMYLPGGHAYVYFIYGMYHCFNVVTGTVDQPDAVLIRAVEPEEGLKFMERNRPVQRKVDLTNGPGKLCLAFGIDQRQDGLSLLKSPLMILPREEEISSRQISKGPRIGIGTHHEACYWPLRFWIKMNPYVSR